MYLIYDGLNRQVSRRVARRFQCMGRMGFDRGIPEWRKRHCVLCVWARAGRARNGPAINTIFKTAAAAHRTSPMRMGHLKEWYRYNCKASPFIYDANNNQLLNHQPFCAPSLHRPAMVSGVWPVRSAQPLLLPDSVASSSPIQSGFEVETIYIAIAENNPVTESDPIRVTG